MIEDYTEHFEIQNLEESKKDEKRFLWDSINDFNEVFEEDRDKIIEEKFILKELLKENE